MDGARFDLAVPGDVRFGRGRVAEVPGVLVALGVRRVLVIAGRSAFRVDGLRTELTAQGIRSDVLTVAGEPTVDVLRDGLETARSVGCDGVLGYGGGSALDVAKAVAVLAPHGTDPLEHLEVIGRGRPVPGPGLPCVAVPTTAGTGSEVTRNAVLAGDGVKASLRSPLLLPRVAVVDPDLLVGLPPATIAAGGLDALTQLVEPFLSSRANPVTDALARDGMRRSARSLRRAVAARPDGAAGTGTGTDAGAGTALDGDPAIREDLALASLLGGLCLANSGLGVVHGFAAAIGGRFTAPHGAVCAAVLAPALDVTFRALGERSPQHPALARGEEIAALLTGADGVTLADGLTWLDELRLALEIPALGRYGLTAADVPAVVAAAARASSTKAHPIELTDDELTEILTRAL